MAEPIINFNSPLLPPEPARKVTTQAPSVTAKQRTKPVSAAIGEFSDANEQAEIAAALKADAQSEQLKVDETVGAPETLRLAQEAAGARHLASAAGGAQIAELRSAAAVRRAEHEKAGNIEPMLTGWKAVLGGVLQGFAQYSHTRVGNAGTAPGVEAWNSAISRDRQAKIDAFKRSGEFADLAAQDVKLAEEALRGKLASIDNEHISAGNLLIKRLEAMKARFKTQEAIASADGVIASARATQAEKLARMEGEFAGNVTRHGQQTTVSEQAPTTGASLRPGQADAAADLNALASNIIGSIENPVSTPTRVKYQKQRAVTMRVAGMTGLTGLAAEVGGREIGAVPQSVFEGIGTKERTGLRFRDTLRAAQQRVLEGVATPAAAIPDIMARLGVDPTDTPDDEAGKMRQFVQEIRNRAVQSGPLEQKYLQLADQIDAKIAGGRRASDKAPAKAAVKAPVRGTGAAPSPGEGAVRKVSPSHGPGWVLGDQFYPDSER